MVINDIKQICSQCQGSGNQAGRPQWGSTQINPGGRCHHCQGRGFVLTELGQELVTLLRPFVMEMIDEARPTQPGPRPAGKPGAPPESDSAEDSP